MLNQTKEHIDKVLKNLVNPLPSNASIESKVLHDIFVLGRLSEVINEQYKQANLRAKEVLINIPKSEANLGKVLHYGYYDIIAHGRGENEPVIEICPLSDEEAKGYMT